MEKYSNGLLVAFYLVSRSYEITDKVEQIKQLSGPFSVRLTEKSYQCKSQKHFGLRRTDLPLKQTVIEKLKVLTKNCKTAQTPHFIEIG